MNMETINNRILTERAARFSQSDTELSNSSVEEMIVFELGSTSYAIPLGMLTELRSLQKLTALPKVSRAIIGLINVRGRIVSVYRLSENSDTVKTAARGDGEQDNATAQNTCNKGFVLIGNGMASNVALLADDITGTRMVSPDDIRQKPISLNDRDYIIGMASDGLVFIDLEKFVSTESQYMA